MIIKTAEWTLTPIESPEAEMVAWANHAVQCRSGCHLSVTGLCFKDDCGGVSKFSSFECFTGRALHMDYRRAKGLRAR